MFSLAATLLLCLAITRYNANRLAMLSVLALLHILSATPCCMALSQTIRTLFSFSSLFTFSSSWVTHFLFSYFFLVYIFKLCYSRL